MVCRQQLQNLSYCINVSLKTLQFGHCHHTFFTSNFVEPVIIVVSCVVTFIVLCYGFCFNYLNLNKLFESLNHNRISFSFEKHSLRCISIMQNITELHVMLCYLCINKCILYGNEKFFLVVRVVIKLKGVQFDLSNIKLKVHCKKEVNKVYVYIINIIRIQNYSKNS